MYKNQWCKKHKKTRIQNRKRKEQKLKNNEKFNCTHIPYNEYTDVQMMRYSDMYPKKNKE